MLFANGRFGSPIEAYWPDVKGEMCASFNLRMIGADAEALLLQEVG